MKNNTTLTIILAAFGSVALAGAVAACDRHGTSAGNHFSAWVASNTAGSAGTIGIDGEQTDVNDDNTMKTDEDGNVMSGSHADSEGVEGAWGNESYWIDITMPDGTPVTVRTYANQLDSNLGGGAMEAWLFDLAQQELRSWFNDYEPVDTQGRDFIG